MEIIILLGPPGSGKGTQADLLHNHLQLPHISTGEILRENIRNKTPLGLAVEDLLNKGQLVPDPLILDILFERTAQPDCQKGYILDGFPRTIAQAQALQERLQLCPNNLKNRSFGKEGPQNLHSERGPLLKRQGPSENANCEGNPTQQKTDSSGCLGIKRPIVLNFMLADQEIIQRLTQRRVCPHCQALYHLIHKPPKKEGTCDACQTPLIQRSDDTESVIAERLRVYHTQTAPLIAFYTQQNSLLNIDCARSKADIFADIQSHICKK